MTSHDLANRLVRKAAQDEYTACLIAVDPLAPDEAIGFHCQQAVEKLLKAILAHRNVTVPRTHNLVQLVSCLRDHHLAFPPELEEAYFLGPFGVALRYDDLALEEDEPFDRDRALKIVMGVREWTIRALERGET